MAGKAAAQHRRVDGARRDGVDADAIRRKIQRHGAGQAENGALGGNIGTVAAPAGERELRRHGDDRAAAGGLHGRDRRPGEQPGSADMNPHHRVPVGRIRGQHRAADGKAGRGHQDGRRRPAGGDGREGGRGERGIPHIARGGHGGSAGRFNRGFCCGETVRVAVDQHETGALAGKEQRGFTPDTGGGPGDESGACGQFHASSIMAPPWRSHQPA